MAKGLGLLRLLPLFLCWTPGFLLFQILELLEYVIPNAAPARSPDGDKIQKLKGSLDPLLHLLHAPRASLEPMAKQIIILILIQGQPKETASLV